MIGFYQIRIICQTGTINLNHLVLKNFKINNQRNSWDKISVLHHAFNDWDNSKYHNVDFKTLVPIYKKILMVMFSKMDLLSDYYFNFLIALTGSNFLLFQIKLEQAI